MFTYELLDLSAGEPNGFDDGVIWVEGAEHAI